MLQNLSAWTLRCYTSKSLQQQSAGIKYNRSQCKTKEACVTQQEGHVPSAVHVTWQELLTALDTALTHTRGGEADGVSSGFEIARGKAGGMSHAESSR